MKPSFHTPLTRLCSILFVENGRNRPPGSSYLDKIKVGRRPRRSAWLRARTGVNYMLSAARAAETWSRSDYKTPINVASGAEHNRGEIRRQLNSKEDEENGGGESRRYVDFCWTPK